MHKHAANTSQCSFHRRSPTRGPVGPSLLQGAIVLRTHDAPKNPYISLFLHTILGPDYYCMHPWSAAVQPKTRLLQRVTVVKMLVEQHPYMLHRASADLVLRKAGAISAARVGPVSLLPADSPLFFRDWAPASSKPQLDGASVLVLLHLDGGARLVLAAVCMVCTSTTEKHSRPKCYRHDFT